MGVLCFEPSVAVVRALSQRLGICMLYGALWVTTLAYHMHTRDNAFLLLGIEDTFNAEFAFCLEVFIGLAQDTIHLSPCVRQDKIHVLSQVNAYASHILIRNLGILHEGQRLVKAISWPKMQLDFVLGWSCTLHL